MFYNVIFSASNALQCPTERIELYHTAMVNSKKDQGAALPVPKKKKTMVDETTKPVIKKHFALAFKTGLEQGILVQQVTIVHVACSLFLILKDWNTGKGSGCFKLSRYGVHLIYNI